MTPMHFGDSNSNVRNKIDYMGGIFLNEKCKGLIRSILKLILMINDFHTFIQKY